MTAVSDVLKELARFSLKVNTSCSHFQPHISSHPSNSCISHVHATLSLSRSLSPLQVTVGINCTTWWRTCSGGPFSYTHPSFAALQRAHFFLLYFSISPRKKEKKKKTAKTQTHSHIVGYTGSSWQDGLDWKCVKM